MGDETLITQRIAGGLAAIESLRDQIPAIRTVCDVVTDVLAEGGTLYTAGNGGSAAQALHLAEELIGRYRADRAPQRAICLNADTCALTCIANDYGFEQIFARQVEALATERDVFLALSTSGNSANIVNALATARRRGAATIGLLGNDGGQARALCDHALVVPVKDSAHVQEAHQVVVHLICEIVEAKCGQKALDAG